MTDEIYRLLEHIQSYIIYIEERLVLCPADTVPEDTDYFNHCCEPNNGFKGQIFLVVMRGIKAREEIIFDYGMTVSESVGSDIVLEMNCKCGAPQCRKKISEHDWKRPGLHARYKGYFSRYT